MDQLLSELAGPTNATAGDAASPFKAFARRAQLVITGLVHISVLLLPRQHEEARGSGAPVGTAKGASAKNGAGGASGSGRPAASNGGDADVAAELAAVGFPSDGSNLDEWQRVGGIAGACKGRPSMHVCSQQTQARHPLTPACLPRRCAGARHIGQDSHGRAGLAELLRVSSY